MADPKSPNSPDLASLMNEYDKQTQQLNEIYRELGEIKAKEVRVDPKALRELEQALDEAASDKVTVPGAAAPIIGSRC